jgi:hypothetical protein
MPCRARAARLDPLSPREEVDCKRCSGEAAFHETAAGERETDTDLIRVKVKMHPYTAHCVGKRDGDPLRDQRRASRNPMVARNGMEERRVRKDGPKKGRRRRRRRESVIVEGGSREPKR